MRKRLGIVLALGIGYVLGTRAGREQYDRIREAASKIRQMPPVAKPFDWAGETVSGIVHDHGERVTDKVAQLIKEGIFGVAPSYQDDRVVDTHATESPYTDAQPQ